MGQFSSCSKQQIGFIAFIFLLQMKSYASTCTVRGQVPDIAKRSRTYQADGIIDSDPYIDDNYLRPGWYSATTMEEGQYLMPDKTTIPNYLFCGTKHPVYLKDQHPNIGEMDENTTISVAACELFPFDDCLNTFGIKIRKCSGQIQYYLVHTSFYSAYCFDPPEIQGETSFQDPPEMSIGSLSVSPKLVFSEITLNSYNSSVPSLEFLCTESGGSVQQRPNILYTTYWYVDHQLIFVFSNESISKVTEKALMSKGFGLGIHIRCGVKISNSIIGLKSPLTMSNNFFAGIQVSDKVINMNRTDTYTLKFTQTVPLGCYGLHDYNITDECKHKVHMISLAEDQCVIGDTNTGGKNPVSYDTHTLCGFEIKGCHPPHLTGVSCNEKLQHYSMTVTTQNFGNDFIPVYSVSLKTQNRGEHDIWKNYTLANVNINIHDGIDIKNKVCYSRLDPHMRTASGRSYQHNDEEGEFILYWNTKYHIQVQEKTVRCDLTWDAFCTCAVAIRSGGDVFRINLCNGSKDIEMTSCKDNSLLIEKKSELDYQVQTNIGTLIKIRINKNETNKFIDIYITMAPKDYKSIRGLCGLLDSDTDQVFHDRNGNHISLENRRQFIKEWRLRASDTNFLTPTCKLNVQPWLEVNRKLFCLCNCNPDNCDGLTSEATCSPSQYINCTVKRGAYIDLCRKYEDRCQIENRKTRSSFIFDPEEEIQRKAKLSHRSKNIVRVKRQAETTVSKETATNMCIERINGTSAVKNYSALLGGYNISSFIQECIYDVYVTQNVRWVSAHEASTKDAVQIGFKINSNYTLMHNDELLDFKRQYCPLNCSGNGNCTDDGICKCESKYFGPDCGNDVTIGPEIEDVEGGGFCDTRYGSECQCFEIQTENLAENFHCKRVHKQVRKDGSKGEIGTDIVSGLFFNLFMGECCFETGRNRRSIGMSSNVINSEYDVSISNDGIHFGPTSTLYIYDSTCLDISSHNTGDITFEIKKNTCMITGICYEEESTDIADDCLKCNALTDQFNWTYSCVDSNDNKQDDRGMISIVIPVTISLVVGIAVVCVVFLAIKNRNKSKGLYSVTRPFAKETDGSVHEENMKYQEKRF